MTMTREQAFAAAFRRVYHTDDLVPRTAVRATLWNDRTALAAYRRLMIAASRGK